MSPTPPGEGKTTTTVGLTDALHGLGKTRGGLPARAVDGPGVRHEGRRGRRRVRQVVPMTDINLHFTGDFGAIALANNLLAALIDNHVHHGNELDIDVRRITWKRVVDMNDRALRDVIDRARRHRQRLPARGRLRHRRRLGADGDLLPHRVMERPQEPPRRHRRRLHAGPETGHGARAAGARRDDGSAQGRARRRTSSRRSRTARRSCTAARSRTSRTAATR